MLQNGADATSRSQPRVCDHAHPSPSNNAAVDRTTIPSLVMSATEESSFVLDALPYVDPVNEDYEHYALALIEKEVEKTTPRSLPAVPPVRFRSEMMENEYQTRVGGGHVGLMDLATSLDPPPDSETDTQVWRFAVDRVRAAYQAELIRSSILEVEKDESATAWKRFNESLSRNLALLRKAQAEGRQTVEEINLTRQQDQQQTAQQLQVLTAQYNDLLQRLFRLKQAVLSLKLELADDDV